MFVYSGHLFLLYYLNNGIKLRFALFVVRSCRFINGLYVHFTVPSLPPKQLIAHNTSSTTLIVTWLPVPDGYVHGILRGYRLLFKLDQNSLYHNVTTVNQTFELIGLQKFTKYSVKVLAFTRIGDGNISDHVVVSTDEDGKWFPREFFISFYAVFYFWRGIFSGTRELL